MVLGGFRSSLVLVITFEVGMKFKVHVLSSSGQVCYDDLAFSAVLGIVPKIKNVPLIKLRFNVKKRNLRPLWTLSNIMMDFLCEIIKGFKAFTILAKAPS